MNSVVVFLSVLFVGVRTMEMTCKIQGSPLPVMCEGDEMEMPAMKKVYSMMEDMEMEEKDERMKTARYRQERLAFEEEQDRESDAKFKELYMRVEKLEMKLKMKEQGQDKDKDMEMYKKKCDYLTDEYCYMIKTSDSAVGDMDYDKAMMMCKEDNAMLASFPDMETYMKIMEKLKMKIMDGNNGISAWIGTKIDPMTGKPMDMEMNHYLMWAQGVPSQDASRTMIIVHARKDNNAQGMYNVYKNVLVNGAICAMKHDW